MNTIIIPPRDSMTMSYQCILFDFNGANVEEKVLFTNKFVSSNSLHRIAGGVHPILKLVAWWMRFLVRSISLIYQ